VERFRAASFLSPFQEIRKASSELRWVGDHAVVAGMFSCGGFSETVMQSKHGKARSRSRNMHLVVRWWQTRRTNQRNLSLSLPAASPSLIPYLVRWRQTRTTKNELCSSRPLGESKTSKALYICYAVHIVSIHLALPIKKACTAATVTAPTLLSAHYCTST
jgi:hypothetical protein